MASPAQSLTVEWATPNAVVFVGTSGVDHFTGGAGNDIFQFLAANLANTDVVEGAGYSMVGGQRLDWQDKDVFTVPT